MDTYAIIIDPEIPEHGGKIISTHPTKEIAERKAKNSNVFKVIEIQIDIPNRKEYKTTHGNQKTNEAETGHTYLSTKGESQATG